MGAPAGPAPGGGGALRAVLRAARPAWRDRDVSAAETKLGLVGVRSTAELSAVLEAGSLNERLRERGFRTFGAETLRALQEALGAGAAGPPAARSAQEGPWPCAEARSAQEGKPEAPAPLAAGPPRGPGGAPEARQQEGAAAGSARCCSEQGGQDARDPGARGEVAGGGVPSLEALLQDLDRADAPGAMDDAAAPPPAAAPAGPLERLSDDELLAQCWSRGLAAGPDTPREAALRLLREALAWEELPPEALREAAARAAPSAATGGDRDALLRALADATWEAAGVPRRRFSSEALACRVLERVRALQAMGATQLLAEGRALGVASQPSMSPEALRSRLGAALVWSHLPGEELLRECEQRGVVLPSSVALGAHGAPEALFIAGSWSDWRVAKLKREGGPGHERFEHLVPIGPEGQESFQLLLEGDWDCTVYPSQPGAHPGMSYEILGPDRCGHGRNWTIGRHAADGARHGDQFLVGVSFEGDPREMRVSWAAASRAAGRGRSSASRFSYSGQPQAPQRSGRQLIVLRLLAQRDLVAGWEARGVPVDRFRGNLSAARALAEQYKLVDQTSTEDLSRWYYSNEGLPRERCITRGELVGLARRMALWELLPLEELRRERAAREEGPEACPDDGDERGALVDALFLHERRAAWEARGFPARRLGSTQATVQLVAECERFGEMDDAALHEALRDAGLPRGAELERARLLGALRALVCWQLLPLPELERDCLERGLPVPDACSDCEKERRAALVSLLRTDLLRSSYEASGIPVARLGVGRASVVVGQLASFGDMSLEQLRAAVEGERQFQAPRMSREELEGRLRKLLVWAALPTPELWAECGAVGIPLAGFERGDPEAGLRAQLLDRLELRERAAWAAAAASAAPAARPGAASPGAGAGDVSAEELPGVWRYVQHMSDPLVSERVCRVRARRTPAGSALLPGAAREWPALEAALYVLSGGAFDPRREVRERSPVAALFSVTCPTSERRAHFHPLLYETFRTQDYEPKELVVVDTGLRPSEFFVKCARDDPRVVYRFFPVDDAREGCRPRGGRAAWTLGLKRNIACCLSRGAAVAHFDDDDLYAPGYLSWMWCRLREAGGAPAGAAEDAEARRLAPAAAKLAEWYLLDISDLSFRFLDAAAAPAGTAGGRRDWLYGWGFSYAFTRSAWELAPFPDVEFAEDMGFVEGLIAHGVPVALARLPCAANGSGLPLGLVAHSCHPGSTSGGEDLASRGRCGVPAGMPHSLARLMPMVRRIQHMWPGLLHDFGPRSTVLGAPLGKRLATGVPRGPLAPRRPQAPRALALQRRR